ncbi:MAG: hypothetical protein H7Y15_17940 [Pseudonocardia sp.]|nr:hypothetical protein [Pseudonocardia sp.]
MRKNYQYPEIDTGQPAVPDTVSVGLAEPAGEMREGKLALAVDICLHGRDHGSGRDRGSVRAEEPPRPRAHRDEARPRCR